MRTYYIVLVYFLSAPVHECMYISNYHEQLNEFNIAVQGIMLRFPYILV